MNGAIDENAGWKRKIRRELIEYGINFVYLAIFFYLFTWYRRLILAEYRITYLHYGISLLESLVLTKIVMLGGTLRLGRHFEDKPLIFPTLYNAIVFTVWVAVFGLIEHTVTGLLRGRGLAAGFEELVSKGRDELLARCLITFVAFIPFFAFKELERALGEGKICALFFRKKAGGEINE